MWVAIFSLALVGLALIKSIQERDTKSYNPITLTLDDKIRLRAAIARLQQIKTGTPMICELAERVMADLKVVLREED